METEYSHDQVDDKKWESIFYEFEFALLKQQTLEDKEQLVLLFESIEKKYREKNASKYYVEMWKVAFKVGKIKLAKSYAELAIDYLIELKRIPMLKKLFHDIAHSGLVKNHKKNRQVDVIIGRKVELQLEDAYLNESHPEMWKTSRVILKNYLEMETIWNIEQWKLAYEYVLRFYYDETIFQCLLARAIEFNMGKHEKKLEDFLSKNGASLDYYKHKNKNMLKTDSKKTMEKEEHPLHIDYDQLAMDILSGEAGANVTEQRKVLISLKDLSDKELLAKGKEMAVAFGLLGMEKVVMSLCERLTPILTEVKERVGVRFIMGQSFYNSEKFHAAIDLIEDVLNSEPLLPEETLAFNYLKAESLLRLKKYKEAKEIFVKIKKDKPRYRLVEEKLRHIEEIK